MRDSLSYISYILDLFLSVSPSFCLSQTIRLTAPPPIPSTIIVPFTFARIYIYTYILPSEHSSRPPTAIFSYSIPFLGHFTSTLGAAHCISSFVEFLSEKFDQYHLEYELLEIAWQSTFALILCFFNLRLSLVFVDGEIFRLQDDSFLGKQASLHSLHHRHESTHSRLLALLTYLHLSAS